MASDPRVRQMRASREDANLAPEALVFLKRMAGKYVWWKPSDEAVSIPDRVIAQIMDIGDYGDVQALVAAVGDKVLRNVLTHAEPGQFNDRSWGYWHYRLGLGSLDNLPKRPSRVLA